MSYGYCGSVSNEVKANLRVDSFGVRCTLMADASFNIADDRSRKVTFTLVVPKYVGFVEIDWMSTLASTDTPDVDYVGWVDSNGVLNSASYTFGLGTETVSTIPTAFVMYGVSDIKITEISGDALALFQKFEITYTLANNTAATITCQKLLTGFSYNKTNIPKTDGTQFSIFASVVIGAESTTLSGTP